MIESVDQLRRPPTTGRRPYKPVRVFAAVRQFADSRHANHVYFVRRLLALVSLYLLLLDRRQLQCHGAVELKRRGDRALCYSAYGTATVYSPEYSTTYSASTVGNTVLFAGMWVDPTTGLARTSTRWDNTVLDTFMTSDPAQAGTNWFEYSGNDPADETDPTGLVTDTPWTPPDNPCNEGSNGMVLTNTGMVPWASLQIARG